MRWPLNKGKESHVDGQSSTTAYSVVLICTVFPQEENYFKNDKSTLGHISALECRKHKNGLSVLHNGIRRGMLSPWMVDAKFEIKSPINSCSSRNNNRVEVENIHLPVRSTSYSVQS